MVDPSPTHIGVILDGNRRFAKKLMLQPWKGHTWGKKKVEKLLNWCNEFSIKELTLYAFSLQNFKRPKEEFNYLMKLFLETYTELKDDARLNELEIRVQFIGRTHLFPEEVQKAMAEVEEKTKNFNKFKVNVAMGYGGREEIIDAIKNLFSKIKSPEEITEETLTQELYLQSEPDLIIRTGGDRRTSNFLLWQSWYSEWFFLEKTWPEFEREDFVACLEEFKQRERRFGK